MVARLVLLALLLSGASLVLLQQFLRRHGLTLLSRLWAALRIFR